MTRLPMIALGAALLLGGCQTVFDLVGVEQPLTASESRHFDGSYQGDIATAAGCRGEQGEKVVMVGDGVLWYAYSPTVLFTAPVRFDGLVTAKSGPATFNGKIVGDHLDATIQSESCQTTLSMDYIFNHS